MRSVLYHHLFWAKMLYEGVLYHQTANGIQGSGSYPVYHGCILFLITTLHNMYI